MPQLDLPSCAVFLVPVQVSVQAAPPGPATTPAQAPTAPAAPQMDSGLLQIDGASLEGRAMWIVRGVGGWFELTTYDPLSYRK